MSMILFSSTLGPVPVDVIISEDHSSTLGITEKPIETGAKITDHSYIEPKKLSLEFADANATATYNALVKFQESRVPFTIVSGLFVYNSMLIRSIQAKRDSQNSRILAGTCELQEVIIVSTSYTSSEGDDGSAKSDGKPGGKKSTQSARPTKERAGDKATADRASGTAARGDAATKTVAATGGGGASGATTNKSILSRLF